MYDQSIMYDVGYSDTIMHVDALGLHYADMHLGLYNLMHIGIINHYFLSIANYDYIASGPIISTQRIHGGRP